MNVKLEHRPMERSSGFQRLQTRTAYRLGAVLVLLLAWALLLLKLGDVPPGFQHDQMFNSRDALDVLQGRFQLYFPSNFGREPLGIYSAALAFLLAGGRYVWSLRFASVAWGMLGLALSLVMARRYLSRPAALLAVVLLGTSFWFLFLARLGLEPASLLPFAVAMVYFLARGLERLSFRDLGLAGLCGGLAIYTYPAGRSLFGLPILLIGYELASWLIDRWRPGAVAATPRRKAIGGLLIVLGLMTLVSAPLFLYVRAHPGAADQRLRELSGALTAARQGQFQPVLANIRDTLLAIVWQGSQALPYHYNIPGRPVLQPLLAPFFLVGLGYTVFHWRKRREAVLLAVVLVGLASNMLTGADALHVRGVIALPFLFILTARGLWIVGGWVLDTLHRPGQPERQIVWLRIVIVLAVATLVVWHVAGSSRAYFIGWSQAEPTQRLYNADFRAAAAYLDAHPTDQPVYIGTDRLYDLDALTYALYEPHRPNVRWFPLPESVPLPSEGGALYLLPASQGQKPPAWALLTAAARDPIRLPASNGVYDLMEGFRLDRQELEQALTAAGVHPLTKPLVYGGAMRLDAAGIRQQGDVAEMITVWTALAPYPRSAPPGDPPAPPKYSLAMTDATGYQWSQFDATSTLPFLYWQPGDMFIDVTRVPLPADLPPGDYTTRLVVYDDIGGALPIQREGAFVATAPAAASLQTTDPVRGEAPPPPYPAESRPGDSTLAAVGRWEPLETILAEIPQDIRVSWRAAETLPAAGLHFRLRATTPEGRLVADQEAPPLQPLPDVWPAGQTYRLTHQAPALSLPPGVDVVNLELCALAASDTVACAHLGAPQVRRQPPLMALDQTPQHALGAEWEGMSTLKGYDVTRNDQALDLTLYWRLIGPPTTVRWRFVHAIDSQGQIVAQADGAPANGDIPMPLWRQGEYIVDRVRLEAPEGSAMTALLVGWYNPETGERLAVQLPTGETPAERQVRLPPP